MNSSDDLGSLWLPCADGAVPTMRPTTMAGPALREASVVNVRGEAIRLRHGARVTQSIRYGARDGGELVGRYSGTIVEIRRGHEHGMHGAMTLLVRIALDTPVDDYQGPITETLFAARLLWRRDFEG